MELPKFKRLPRHVGVIPDGNRRWAQARELPKEAGYEQGIQPGLKLYELCLDLGIEEMSFYGFTQENTRRPAVQRRAFQQACVESVNLIAGRDAALLVIGNSDSPMFPSELKPYTRRVRFGSGAIKVNFLVNYGWNWDLGRALLKNPGKTPQTPTRMLKSLASADVSRVDLVVRWGGRSRLSGFLPAQSAYADFYTLDYLWPDFAPEQFFEALTWYERQDVTLGG